MKLKIHKSINQNIVSLTNKVDIEKNYHCFFFGVATEDTLTQKNVFIDYFPK